MQGPDTILLGLRVFCFDYDRKKIFRPDLPNDGSSDEFLLVYEFANIVFRHNGSRERLVFPPQKYGKGNLVSGK